VPTGEAFAAASFSGQTTIGGSVKNAGFNQFGALFSYELPGNTSAWQAWIEGQGFLSVDKVFYDESAHHVYSLAKIGTSATYFDGTTSTPMTAIPPGNAFALLKTDAATGALLDFTTLSVSSLALATGVIKNPSGVYVAINTFFSTLFPDLSNPLFSIPSSGGVDIDLLKFDLSLNYQAHRKIGTPAEDFATRIRQLATDRMAVMGYQFRETRLAGPQPESQAVSAQAVLYVFDGNLGLVDSIVTGGNGFDVFFDAAMDAQGMLFAGGMFTDTTDLDPDTTATFPLVSDGSFDGFIAKYDMSYLVGLQDPAAPGQVSVWPNPAEEYLTLNALFRSPAAGRIEMYDASGRCVLSEAYPQQAALSRSLDCRTLQPGLYILRILHGGIPYAKKVTFVAVDEGRD
jgi:hypothetical protein